MFFSRVDGCWLSYVLIVPLWNWNDVASAGINAFGSFNRTFMELKYVLCLSFWKWCVRFNRTFMELKLWMQFLTLLGMMVLIVPLWNWNKEWGKNVLFSWGFNRTFMELKLSIRSLTLSQNISFNRTFMELKYF